MKTRRKRKEPPRPELGAKESILCDAFAAAARGDGWTVYPEVGAWDLVLVQDGIQVGVQAKLRGNVTVLRQAMRGRSHRTGPRFRAVLVPKATRDFRELAAILGLGVYQEINIRDVRRRVGYYVDKRRPIETPSRPWEHSEALWLPPVATDRPAGVPCPSGLTRWRVAAIKLCLVLEARGYVTRDDFRKWGIDKTRWVVYGWIKANGKIGRLTRYIAGTELPIETWRDVAAELLETDEELHEAVDVATQERIRKILAESAQGADELDASLRDVFEVPDNGLVLK